MVDDWGLRAAGSGKRASNNGLERALGFRVEDFKFLSSWFRVSIFPRIQGFKVVGVEG